MPRLSTNDISRFLASPLLAGVEDSSRTAIFAMLNQTQVSAGTTLLSQGLPNDRLWFVIAGSVAIERRHPDGRVDVLATMTAPAIFGMTTFFRSNLPSTTIRATSNLTLGSLDREAHEQLRREDPRIAEALAVAVLRVLSEHFDMLDQKISELMAKHGEGHPRANEWANFRTRLFEEPSI